jgi:murein L,D-transpeptidase YcbB/YkuD
MKYINIHLNIPVLVLVATLSFSKNSFIEQKATSESFQGSVIYRTQFYLLEKHLSDYGAIAEQGGWQQLPEGTDSLREGAKDTVVLLLRKRLEEENYLEAKAMAVPDSFDTGLVFALKTFQKNNGLVMSGSLDSVTISILNIPVEKRIEQIKINMERWKALPENLGEHYLFVNVADFKLQEWKDDSVILSMKVVVGKTYRQTPMFHAKISHVIFNPTWNIPSTILKEDILPLVLKDTSYLRKRHIRIYQTKKGGERREVPPDSVDWENVSSEDFPYELIQDAGKDNMLGVAKFMFPNPYNVYMHDTPSKELFAETERTFSSGCIRVSNATALAGHLLKWNRKKVLRAIESGETTIIYLDEPVNVFIEYFTAWVDPKGILQFRKDVYDRDPAINKPPEYRGLTK